MDEKNRTVNGSLYYGNGFMKAAFGSFIEGLDVIYCNDLCADIVAERFNVTWVRTSPMVMSVHDDIHGTVLSGESSFYFECTDYGDSDVGFELKIGKIVLLKMIVTHYKNYYCF